MKKLISILTAATLVGSGVTQVSAFSKHTNSKFSNVQNLKGTIDQNDYDNSYFWYIKGTGAGAIAEIKLSSNIINRSGAGTLAVSTVYNLFSVNKWDFNTFLSNLERYSQTEDIKVLTKLINQNWAAILKASDNQYNVTFKVTLQTPVGYWINSLTDIKSADKYSTTNHEHAVINNLRKVRDSDYDALDGVDVYVNYKVMNDILSEYINSNHYTTGSGYGDTDWIGHLLWYKLQNYLPNVGEESGNQAWKNWQNTVRSESSIPGNNYFNNGWKQFSSAVGETYSKKDHANNSIVNLFNVKYPNDSWRNPDHHGLKFTFGACDGDLLNGYSCHLEKVSYSDVA